MIFLAQDYFRKAVYSISLSWSDLFSIDAISCSPSPLLVACSLPCSFSKISHEHFMQPRIEKNNEQSNKKKEKKKITKKSSCLVRCFSDDSLLWFYCCMRSICYISLFLVSLFLSLSPSFCLLSSLSLAQSHIHLYVYV